MIVAEWLREKLTGKSEEALLSDIAKNNQQILWFRVNDLIKEKSNHFTEAHPEDLAHQAIKIACEKTQSAELARCAAEAELEQVKAQIGSIVRQLTDRMEQSAFQLAATEQRAIAAEQRAMAAVTRANEAEASLKRLQAEVLAKAMMKQLVSRAA